MYFCRQDPEVPLPLLKLELVGSQAISPAAAMIGSEAAKAALGVAIPLAGDSDSHIKPIIVAIEIETPNRLKRINSIKMMIPLLTSMHEYD